MLDSGIARDFQSKPGLICIRQYSGQGQHWMKLADTIKNCCNKVRILSTPVIVLGGGARVNVID